MTSDTLPGFAALADRYDAFVLDLWGTLHNGIEPLPGAVDCLRRLHATGKPIALLSNAPQRAGTLEIGMAKMGIPADLYDLVYSSGEEVWLALATRADPWYRRLGRRGYFLGSERDYKMAENPGLERAPLEVADYVLCIGLTARDGTIADHADELRAARARALPLICANPDLVVLRGDNRELCAGALAKYYEDELGGAVRWHGKPHPSVFENCLAWLGVADPARALMVGDALRTDVAGAAGVGMASALVLSGINAAGLGIAYGEAPAPDRLAALLETATHRPDATISAFVW